MSSCTLVTSEGISRMEMNDCVPDREWSKLWCLKRADALNAFLAPCGVEKSISSLNQTNFSAFPNSQSKNSLTYHLVLWGVLRGEDLLSHKVTGSHEKKLITVSGCLVFRVVPSLHLCCVTLCVCVCVCVDGGFQEAAVNAESRIR